MVCIKYLLQTKGLQVELFLNHCMLWPCKGCLSLPALFGLTSLVHTPSSLCWFTRHMFPGELAFMASIIWSHQHLTGKDWRDWGRDWRRVWCEWKCQEDVMIHFIMGSAALERLNERGWVGEEKVHSDCEKWWEGGREREWESERQRHRKGGWEREGIKREGGGER